MRERLACVALLAMSVGPQARVHAAPPAEEPTSYQDVAGAPTPEQATGVRVPEDLEGGHTGRAVLRAVLAVPRWTFWIAVQPVRGALWAYERYALADRFEQIFFNDEGTLGAYPVAFFETGFGLNVGARLIIRDQIGPESETKLRASYGGRYRQLYSLDVDTGEALGHRVTLELEAAYEIFPKSRFFGLGNAELIEADDVTEIVDPRARDVAVRTRYRHNDASVELAGLAQLIGDLSLRASARYRYRTFDEDADLSGGERQLRDVFATDRLTGFGEDLSSVGGELELILDTRRATEFYLAEPDPNAGWKLSGFLAFQQGLGDDPSDFLRYGVDAQRVLDLNRGLRTLTLRAYVEGVSGGIDDVPFLDLPKLGGPIFLRGYARDRFRDRVAALGSAEYDYLVNKFLTAYLFVDAGRVYRRVSDIEASGFRVGYGAGIQAHSRTTFRGRFDISSSIDGDIFFNLSFDPVYDTRSRKEYH